jgi:hypothetical protein
MASPLARPPRGREAWWSVLVPGDAVRALAVVSVVVGTARGGGVAAALFLLVLGGTMVPRAIGAPPGIDAAYGGVLLVAAWAAQLDWYVAVDGLDVVVHAVATGLVALMTVCALRRWHVLGAPPAGRRRWGTMVEVVGVGAVGALVWELGEWAGHTFLDGRIQVGYEDTVGDLAAGLAGSVLAALLLRRLVPSDGPDHHPDDRPDGRPGYRPSDDPDVRAEGGQLPVRVGPTVSVVIPARDDAVALEECLARLSSQTVPPSEVVVVDNASTDRTAAVAAAWGARVVREPRPGIPAAAATGYDSARGDVIARLDADSRPGPHWVERIARTMADDPALDAVTGSGRFVDLPPALRGAASRTYLGAYYALGHLALGHTALWGSSMAIRRGSWLTVRTQVSRDPDVHDDLDLAFALGPHRRIRRDGALRVGVSARSLRGRAQRRQRLDRAWRTLRRNWDTMPPWARWGSRLTRSRTMGRRR